MCSVNVDLYKNSLTTHFPLADKCGSAATPVGLTVLVPVRAELAEQARRVQITLWSFEVETYIAFVDCLS